MTRIALILLALIPFQSVALAAGGITVRHAYPFYVDQECRRAGAAEEETILACAIGTIPINGSCEIVLPHPWTTTPRMYRALEKHEMAHCLGWTHD